MPTNLLMIHGNGGANARFQLFVEAFNKTGRTDLRIHLPELPGFEGRPYPAKNSSWRPFLDHLKSIVQKAQEEEWIFYGHGIGGSFLLEWATQAWALDNGKKFKPKLVIMHSIIGASLQARWFPKVMKLKPIRSIIHWMIYQKPLQKRWEKRLFLDPVSIPQSIRDQFFIDYKGCAAFPVLFDLITPKWYQSVQSQTQNEAFYFLWGGKERVVAANYLEYWKKDYPNGIFELVPEWDHFPMLENPTSFYDKLMEIIAQR